MVRPSGLAPDRVAVADVAISPVSAADVAAVGECYWRAYLETSLEMTLYEPVADVDASWAGEYGARLAGGSLVARVGTDAVGAILAVTDAP